MKPKTKLQKQVAELSSKLPAITDKQRKWAIEHCFEKIGYLRKKSIWCTECGHTWQPHEGPLLHQLCGATCPHCGKILKVENGLKSKEEIREYYSIITSFKGFQVLRHFVASRTCKVGYPAQYEVREAVQNWITSDGQTILMYRCTRQSFMYYDLWDWNSPLEVRSEPRREAKYNIFASYIYPTRSYIHNIKRNGFKGHFYGISPLDLFRLLLTNPMAETLIKAKQYSLLKYLSNRRKIDYWPSVKICIRNNYIVKDASIWLDYLRMLEKLGKDVRNAFYVCQDNLTLAHDKAVNKVRDIEAKKNIEKKRAEAAKHEEEYKKLKGKFFGIEFSDGLIRVSVLTSVQEFLEEGEFMHHCVYSADYWSREDSLILSAHIEEKRLETVEINLKTMNVVQSRGVCNKKTEYHDRIIGIVKQNINLIRQRIA